MPAQASTRRTLASLGLIPATLAAAAIALAALDAVPGAIQGRPRGTRRFASLAEAAPRLPRGILLPAYFPDSLAWPAARILARTRRPEALALQFDLRDNGRPALLLCQTWSSEPCPATLLTPLDVFHTVETRVGLRPARLNAGRLGAGETWEELTLSWDHRSLTVRWRGRTLDLLRIAGSLREERP